ncbi:UNVERIFIED_CONTAM: hypothetical protein NCL1_08934 [Trichonephila clavipes]
MTAKSQPLGQTGRRCRQTMVAGAKTLPGGGVIAGIVPVSFRRFCPHPAQARKARGIIRGYSALATCSQHQALPHAGCHQEGRRAEGRGPRHHRPRRRRAGLRYPGAHQGRRAGRHRQGLHQVHRGRRHPGPEEGHHRQVQARSGPRLRGQPDPRVLRRQAELLQPVAGAAEQGRRSHHSGTVLGLLPGHGDHCRRHPGDRRVPAVAGLQDHRRPARSRHHAEDPPAGAELAVEPDRHGLQQGRAAGAGRGAAQAPAGAGRHRRHVRAHHLDRREVREHRHRGAGPVRPHHRAQRRVQGLRHDRLAHRLLRRPAEAHRRHDQRAVAVDLEPDLDLAGRRRSRAERPAGCPGAHGQGLQGAP